MRIGIKEAEAFICVLLIAGCLARQSNQPVKSDGRETNAAADPQTMNIPTGARRIDTNSKPIKAQVKKTYSFPQPGVAFSNEFPSARMSSARELGPNQ